MTEPGTEDREWDLSGLLVEIDPPLGGLDKLRRRARRQRRTRRSMAAAAAVVVVIGATVGIVRLTGDNGQSQPVNVVGPPSTQSAVVVPPAPASAARGARPLDWGDVRVWLPAAWTPSGAAVECHSQGFSELASGAGIGLAPCDYAPGQAALTISKLAGTAPAGGHRATINGIAVVEYSAEGTASATIDVPSLHTKLTAGSAADGIVATLQPSATYDLLAAPALQGRQPDWQQVVYAGIQLDVPTSWQLERVGYSPCNSLGSGQPDVVFGPLHSASGCAGEAFPAVPTTDGGVSIDAGGGTPTVGKALVENHGPLTLTLAAIADTPAGIDVRVTGGAHPVDVELAIGASANVTAEIIGSIALASAATSGPTTTTTNAGFAVCATSQLDVALDRRTGASGTALYVFTAKDTGPPCALSGYFRISVNDRSGTLLSATDQLETTNPVGQPASARFLNLATGDEVTIAVAVDENPAGSATTCPIIGSFRLTPPDGTAYRQVAIGSSPYFCGGPESAIDVYPPTPGAPPEDY